MKKERKISFLIPAHNEEKIIAKTLENLINLPWQNYEVIVGLDGCTDNTESIVKKFQEKFKRIKYYKLNLRRGKPAVIDRIIKYAKGEIIIINDADWIFSVKDKESFYDFISAFECGRSSKFTFVVVGISIEVGISESPFVLVCKYSPASVTVFILFLSPSSVTVPCVDAIA